MEQQTIAIKPGLGAFKGVFLPNILQMLGVILFMRLSTVLGSVGPFHLSTIIAISSSLLLITSLSMSSIVSNMKVEGGGAYYLISRMLGIEFGSAIGILLCIAQHVTIALSITGFVLSMQEIFPQIPKELVQGGVLFSLVLISYLSTEMALKTHIVIFLLLTLSICSIFFLSDPTKVENFDPTQLGAPLSFWVAFAIFFPITTGIETGMSLSGELKNPSRTLPIGTISSVLVAFAVYLTLSHFLSHQVSKGALLSHPFIFFHLSKFKLLLMLGIWGATLSNALSNILGAPRILQALAKDGVLPAFLKNQTGSILFMFSFALILILSISIDQILPILTMTCLVTYGLINFVAFFEGFIQNPSFRPTFSIPWTLSLIGSVSCFIIMLMINSGATIIVLSLVVCLYLWISSRKLGNNWDDLRHSLLSFLIHRGASKLGEIQPNAKSWRPHILTLIDDKTHLKNVAYFSHALDQGKGFLTFGTCLEKQDKEEDFERAFQTYQIPYYLHVNRSEGSMNNFEQIIKNYGMGVLKPNTVVLPIESELLSSNPAAFFKNINLSGKNILLHKSNPFDEGLYTKNPKTPKKIHLWWRGSNQKNFELSLALSCTLRGSPIWAGSLICIKSIVTDAEEADRLKHVFENYKTKMRLKDVLFEPIIDPEKKFFKDLLLYSKNADFTFLGLRAIEKDETLEDYNTYFSHVVEKTDLLRNCCFVLSGENLKFDKIFV